jgi:methylmalonyl-CoA mutase
VKVYLANIGPLKTHKIRADFSRAFFEPAGVRIVYAKGQDTAEAIADGILDSGAGVAILCGTDDDYPEMVPKVCSMVREQSQEPILLLAGHPGDHEQAYKDAGLDDYIFIKSNNHAVLKNCLQRMGVL